MKTRTTALPSDPAEGGSHVDEDTWAIETGHSSEVRSTG